MTSANRDNLTIGEQKLAMERNSLLVSNSWPKGKKKTEEYVGESERGTVAESKAAWEDMLSKSAKQRVEGEWDRLVTLPPKHEQTSGQQNLICDEKSKKDLATWWYKAKEKNGC